MEGWVPCAFDDPIWQVVLHVFYLKARPRERFICKPDLSGTSVECSVNVKVAELRFNL